MTSALEILARMRNRIHCHTDRLFMWLLLAQWVFAIVLALVISPFSYAGDVRSVHFHVYAAIGFGGFINLLPIVLIRAQPGAAITRHVVAASQMMWSALLIMITGGRIEMHFHVFGSIAFLAFYRDWRVLVTATCVVAGDHLVRGLWWPQSVYGIDNPEWWRFLEHSAWIAFEDTVLLFGIYRAVLEMQRTAENKAELLNANERIEAEVQARTCELHDAMTRYRSLVENTEAIPFEYDTVAEIVRYIAPRASRMLEYKHRELDEHMFDHVVHADDLERLRVVMRTFATSSETRTETAEVRLLTKTGRVLTVHCFLSDRDADTHRVRGVLLDITKQRQMELDLRDAQKLESVGRLAAGIAHEINTPIQYIADSLEFARDAVGDLCIATASLRAGRAVPDSVDLEYIVEELPKAIDRAREGSERVASIIQSMRVFAHPRPDELGWVDLNGGIESTLTISRNEYKYVADIDLRTEELPPIRGALGELNQAFLNIIVNAAHAITDVVKDSGARGTITITTRRDGDHVVVSIGDTGTGIPEAARQHIFEMFFTTKPVGRGTGQGLSFARSIIIKHGGTLTFDTGSTGTTFHIRLPIGDQAAQLKEAA